MFSSRFHWNPEPNRLTQALAARREKGGEVLDLTLSNPTTAGLAYDAAIITRAMSQPAIMRYTPHPRGLAEARAAVSAYYARRGDAVPPEHIHLTASTSEAYSFLLKLLTDPGDEILVPRPSYPLVEFLASLEHVHVARYGLRYDQAQGWEIDFTSLEAALTARTRAVLVVNPNNPTGNHLRGGEARRLLAFCRENGLALVCDEVFFDYTLLDAVDACSTASLAPEAPIFTLNGFSKILALPQMKLGWIATIAPADLLPAILDTLDIIADTYLSVGTPVQTAAADLFTTRDSVQRAITARCRANRRALAAALEAPPGARLLHAQGGWYAVVRVDGITADEDFLIDMLETHGVLLHAGYFFDFVQKDCLVLGLLTPEVEFALAVSRIFQARSR